MSYQNDIKLIQTHAPAFALSDEQYHNRLRIISRRAGMINRCYNPNANNYRIYGGRGIAVCDEWRDKNKGLIKFIDWFCGELSKFNNFETLKEALDILEIDRINNKKGYSPQNCQLLERHYNQYTTIMGSRCAKYAGQWYPLWYCEKLMGVDRNNKKPISEKISASLRHYLDGKHIANTHFMFSISDCRQFIKTDWRNANRVTKKILNAVNNIVWFDFRENPLIFDFSTQTAQCPKCKGEVSFRYENKTIQASKKAYVKCNRCDFKHLILHNARKTILPDVYDSLRELPIKIFDKRMQWAVKNNEVQKCNI